MERQPWNKGKTKTTHPSVLKMSETMRQKKIDNFKSWREKKRQEGVWKIAEIEKSVQLAELVGVILGDGNIQIFPRCERLIISSHSENKTFIERYSNLVENLFVKAPSILKTKENCVRISLYQKEISKRLLIPVGSRQKLNNLIPVWITTDKKFVIACLKGLFEAEGSLSIHLPTYTYNFQFTNTNKCLLDFVKNNLLKLGFNPEERPTSIRLRKKKEVLLFKDLINFRKNIPG